MNPLVEVTRADVSLRETIRNLYQLYQYDVSEHSGGTVGPDGLFRVTRYLDDYWSDEDRYPFICRADAQLCGFALVRRVAPKRYAIAEFFVLRRYRGVGIGKRFAFDLFDRFQAQWSVAQEEENLPAQHFWRKVIGDYTQGNFQTSSSTSQPRGPKLEFSNFK